MRFERRFDLDGWSVFLTGEGDDLAVVVERLLGHYALPAQATAGEPAVVIAIEQRDGVPVALPDAPRFRFPPMTAWARGEHEGGGYRLIDDVADVVVTAPSGPTAESAARGHTAAHTVPAAEIRGWVSRDADRAQLSRFAGLTLWVALMEALRPRRRYPLHGAALVGPGGNGQTLLLAGTKGAGKSTATLALLESGWDVVSDDTLFLERDAAGAVTMIGYEKRFHVRPDLFERRPDLLPLSRRPEPWEPQDKRWLALDERFPGRTRRRAGAPGLIVFPTIADTARSRVEPLAPRAALLGLLADSSFVFLRPDLAPDHLACLGQLVDGARAARLHAGRDLLADPTLYTRLVDEVRGHLPWNAASASS